MRVLTPAEAAREADVVMLTLPDETAADVSTAEEIEPQLQPGNYLAVAHGFNIHFGRDPARRWNQRLHGGAQGPGPHRAPALRRGARRALAGGRRGRIRPETRCRWRSPTPRAIGAGRAGIIETNFREETETDLFGEQAVLCGGLTALMAAGYETLVDAGYAPEMAYFETIHEVKLIVDLIYEGGVANMRYSVSNTAEYGDLTRGPQVIDESVRERMRGILRDIQEGRFAREFVLENKAGGVSFDALRKRAASHPMEAIGARLRGLMPWLKEKQLVDRTRN